MNLRHLRFVRLALLCAALASDVLVVVAASLLHAQLEVDA